MLRVLRLIIEKDGIDDAPMASYTKLPDLLLILNIDYIPTSTFIAIGSGSPTSAKGEGAAPNTTNVARTTYS